MTRCPLSLSELLRDWMRKSDLSATLADKGLRLWQGLLSAWMLVCECMSVMGTGETHTLTQDMREKGVCVSSYREGRRREEACLYALSEAWMRRYRKVSGKSEKTICSCKRVVVLGLFLIDSILELIQNQQGDTCKLQDKENLWYFLTEKMSDSGVNPHLEGIISDFEGL